MDWITARCDLGNPARWRILCQTDRHVALQHIDNAQLSPQAVGKVPQVPSIATGTRIGPQVRRTNLPPRACDAIGELIAAHPIARASPSYHRSNPQHVTGYDRGLQSCPGGHAPLPTPASLRKLSRTIHGEILKEYHEDGEFRRINAFIEGGVLSCAYEDGAI